VDCCHKSSTIVFLPKFDEENVQMSRLDAFSLKHSAILLRIKKRERYIIKTYIYQIQLHAGMLKKTEAVRN